MEKDITFEDLVNKAYEKATGYEYDFPFVNNLKGKLDFMVKIDKRASSLQEKVLVHPKELTPDTNAKYWKNKTPKNLIINGRPAPELLYARVAECNKARKVDMKELYEAILAQLSVQSPDKKDKDFTEAYNQWRKNSKCKTEAERISTKMSALIGASSSIQYRFSSKLDELVKFEKEVDAAVTAASETCESMALNSPSEDYARV